MNCLVVEDNAINLKVVTKYLEKLNIGTYSACNGKEAIVSLEKNKYDFIVLDLQMPEMDGREVLSWMRGHSSIDIKNLIVFVISAASLDNTEDEVLALGANYFLSKPINREKFNHYIEDIKKQLSS